MSDQINIGGQSFVQRRPGWTVGVVFFVVIGLYLFKFHGGLSGDQGTWGQFGDFVGGLVNPIIGFCTILLLSVSLRQNHMALSQANLALAQAKEELGLTREAIEQAAGIQKATEDALKEQIAIAASARDMNNVVALHSGLVKANAAMTDQIRDGRDPDGQLLLAVRRGTASLIRLNNILKIEEERLVKVYDEVNNK